MFKNLRRFIALPFRCKILFAEAFFLVFTAKLLLLVIPVKSVVRISLKRNRTVTDTGPDVLTDIKLALNRADRLTFWKNRCLVKCIAGRRMLGRRGIASVLYFGVRHADDGTLTAHAWLTAGGIEVVEKGGEYLELSAF